jgi:hypothetical protein
MRTHYTRLLVLLAACALALVVNARESHADVGNSVQPFIWQLGRDYPEGTPADESLPIDTVYIKTHDGTDWMSTYDDHPLAVSGPDSLRNLINIYNSEGIGVVAWFVPKGLDYNGQLAIAEQVIDTGVQALYADLEPFSGFCNQNCGVLADSFWARLRTERPSAKLGVIYDPRSWWFGPSAADRWLASANVALPMCYWDDFTGQVPYGDAQGCTAMAKWELDTKLAPGRNLDFIPILEGDSTPDKIAQAMDAAARAEADGVSIWRRGVVSQDSWNTIAIYGAPGGPHCALHLVDGCVVREAFVPATYLIAGGARLPINPDVDLPQLGLSARDVQTLPEGMLKTIPDVPPDGSLLRDGSGKTYVVYGGAKFVMAESDYAGLGLDPNTADFAPADVLAQLPLAPPDYSRVQQFNDSSEYVTLKGARIPLDADALEALKAAGHANDPKYVLPSGAFAQLPLAEVKRGDSDCDGAVALLDVVRVLQKAIGVPSPGICLHVAGDVTCDGWAFPGDALLILRFVAGVPQPASACPPVGEPEPAALPVREQAIETNSATPTPLETPVATATDSATPTSVETASPSPTATVISSATQTAAPSP